MEEFVRDVFIRNSKLSYTKRIKIQNSLHSTLGQLPLLTCKYRVDEGGDLIYTVASEVNETLWSRILSSIRKENENDSLCFLEKIRIEFDQVNKHTKQTKNDFYIFPLEKEVSVVQEFQSSVLHFLQNCTFSSATSSAAVSEQCDKIRKITFDAKTELDFFLLKMNNQFNKYAEEKLAYHRVMAKLKNLKSNTTCTYLYIRDITPELFATENIDYASLLNKNTKSPQEWITSISEIYTNANLTSSIQNTLDLNKFYEFQKVQFPLFKALEQKEIVKRRNNKELEGYNKTTQVKLDAFLEEEKHKLEKMKQLERRVSLFFRQTIDSLYYHEGYTFF